MAYLNGHQDHFTWSAGRRLARGRHCISLIVSSGGSSRIAANPELATRRMKAVLATRGIEA
jgi:hypothetical protein